MKKALLFALSLLLSAYCIAADSTTPLNFTAVNGPATIRFDSIGSPATANFYCSTDSGRNWAPYTLGSTLNLPSGMTVFFSASSASPNATLSTTPLDYYHFEMTGTVAADGNIMSLFNGNLQCTTVPRYALYGLFKDCTSLTSAPVLAATTLSGYSCVKMFSGCTSLTSVPALAAVTLDTTCGKEMFSGCSSLTVMPTLPATVMAEHCYKNMFKDCTSLTTIPSLPATTLANNCYLGMFQGCTALQSAPTLPLVNLAVNCYHSMFKGCTALRNAPLLPATSLPEGCYNEMFSGCTSLETAPALPATTLDMACYCGMFYNCESLKAAPALPAKTMHYYCYHYMFYGCKSLTALPELPATSLAEYCYSYMFANCTNLKIDTAAPGTPWLIPSGAAAVADWNTDMFSGTAGNFTSNPGIDTTYYVSSQRFTVTALANDSTMGTIAGADSAFFYNDTVTLTAIANSGYRFKNWSTGETSAVISFIITSDTTLTANFEANPSAVEDAQVDGITAFSDHLAIILSGASGSRISVYDATGRLLSIRPSAATTETIPVPQPGIYIINITTTSGTTRTAKLIVK